MERYNNTTVRPPAVKKLDKPIIKVMGSLIIKFKQPNKILSNISNISTINILNSFHKTKWVSY